MVTHCRTCSTAGQAGPRGLAGCGRGTHTHMVSYATAATGIAQALTPGFCEQPLAGQRSLAPMAQGSSASVPEWPPPPLAPLGVPVPGGRYSWQNHQVGLSTLGMLFASPWEGLDSSSGSSRMDLRCCAQHALGFAWNPTERQPGYCARARDAPVRQAGPPDQLAVTLLRSAPLRRPKPPSHALIRHTINFPRSGGETPAAPARGPRIGCTRPAAEFSTAWGRHKQILPCPR